MVRLSATLIALVVVFCFQHIRVYAVDRFTEGIRGLQSETIRKWTALTFACIKLFVSAYTLLCSPTTVTNPACFPLNKESET